MLVPRRVPCYFQMRVDGKRDRKGSRFLFQEDGNHILQAAS